MLVAPVAICVTAVVLRLISGVGFANYDSLYALVWGQQLSRGETPSYGVAIAPTPHPLVEAVGFVLSPLGPGAMEDVLVALGYLALAGVGWIVFRLGTEWFRWEVGALAALLVLTRVPVLSYGVRAYVDVPYLLFVLWALLMETRRGPRAGWPVLLLLAVAGLLRPEAWVFSGLYWLWLAFSGGRSRGELGRLLLLTLAAPFVWLLSDLLVTGDALWSLTNTRATAQTLQRVTGIEHVPEYIPRRIGEISRPPVLVGAALGGVLSLLWLRARALPGAVAGLVAVVVFAAFATAGLPINTRYAFLAASLLCIFCAVGVFGWLLLPLGDRRRRWWMAAGLLVALGLIAYIPSQYRRGDRELDALAGQQAAGNSLVGLVSSGQVSLRCGPIGVPNHRPVPLLALRLKASPERVVSAQVQGITSGTYVAPASAAVAREYILDLHDPHPVVASVPLGFAAVGGSRDWLVYERCG